METFHARSLLAFLALVLLLASCQPRDVPTEDERTITRASLIAPRSESVTDADVVTPTLCSPPLTLTPTALATRWPSLIGRRVKLRVAPIRALAVNEWLVVAGNQHFVVLAEPDTTWTVGHVFVVSGSTTAPIHGRTSLPELILDDDCSA